MHPTKVAAFLSLAVAVIATIYLCVVIYQNEGDLKGEFAALNSIERSIQTGEEDKDFEDNSTLEYLISGGVATVALITSLALFGAAKSKSVT